VKKLKLSTQNVIIACSIIWQTTVASVLTANVIFTRNLSSDGGTD
jgi:hypothetical protein